MNRCGMPGGFWKLVLSGVFLALVLFSASCASYEIKSVTEYEPDKKGAKKEYQLKKLRIVVESEPDRSRPEVVFKVERCKVDYLQRKVITRRYKIWDDGRPREKVDGGEKSVVETSLIPEPVWIPWKGQKIKVKVSESGEVFEIESDEQGSASFDVSKFSQCWIEGRDLTVTYQSNIPDHPDMPLEIWDKAKQKRMSMPDFAKAMGKFAMVDIENKVTVPKAALEKIFDK